MDQIIIENLQIYAHHGVYREENERGQNFYINAVLETDTVTAGTLDDLEFSTNYGAVCRFLDEFVKRHTYRLIETVAEKAAEAVLLNFPLIRQVTLEVRKPRHRCRCLLNLYQLRSPGDGTECIYPAGLIWVTERAT